MGFSEHGNIPLGFIKYMEFLDRGGGHYLKEMLRSSCVLIILIVVLQYKCTDWLLSV